MYQLTIWQILLQPLHLSLFITTVLLLNWISTKYLLNYYFLYFTGTEIGILQFLISFQVVFAPLLHHLLILRHLVPIDHPHLFQNFYWFHLLFLQNTVFPYHLILERRTQFLNIQILLFSNTTFCWACNSACLAIKTASFRVKLGVNCNCSLTAKFWIQTTTELFFEHWLEHLPHTSPGNRMLRATIF